MLIEKSVPQIINLFDAVIDTPIGLVGIRTEANQLCYLDFIKPTELITAKTAFAKEVVQQLKSYFTNSSFHFDIPLLLKGTALQQQIWWVMAKIPLGKTANYGELASQLKTHARVVGNACRRNPVPIIIPCHRVVAKNHLGGFAGQMQGELINKKQWLLNHENTLN